MTQSRLPQERFSQIVAPAPCEGGAALRYIIDAPVATPPNAISFPGDELALAEYEGVHSALARQLFNRLDYVAGQVIQADKDVQESFVADDRVVLSRFSIGDLHSYEILRHNHQDGDVQYVVARTDDGQHGNHGGFHLVRKSGGVVLFRVRGTDPVDEGSDEYFRALAQAGRFVDVYARHVSVPSSLVHATSNVTTTEQFRERILRERMWHNRALKKLGQFAHGAKQIGLKLVTNEVAQEDDYGSRTVRKLAPGKIALLAALAPIPGYSERIAPDVPGLMRPASIEVVIDVAEATVLAEGIQNAEERRELAAYHDEDYSLPSLADLALDGSPHDIAVVSSVSPRISAEAPSYTQVEPATNGKNVTLDGLSPIRVETDGLLAPDACTAIDIRPSAQTGDYSLAGNTESDVAGLHAEASQGSIRICNSTDRSVLLHDRRFYVDASR